MPRPVSSSRQSATPVSRLFESLPISDKLSRSLSVTSQAIPIWEKNIDAALREHTQLAHFEDGVLVVTADSPIWANLLHHQQNSVLATFHDAGLNIIRHIYIRTAPRQSLAASTSKTQRPAGSRSVTQSLRVAANTIGDPDVREALNRLARTLSKPE